MSNEADKRPPDSAERSAPFKPGHIPLQPGPASGRMARRPDIRTPRPPGQGEGEASGEGFLPGPGGGEPSLSPPPGRRPGGMPPGPGRSVPSLEQGESGSFDIPSLEPPRTARPRIPELEPADFEPPPVREPLGHRAPRIPSLEADDPSTMSVPELEPPPRRPSAPPPPPPMPTRPVPPPSSAPSFEAPEGFDQSFDEIARQSPAAAPPSAPPQPRVAAPAPPPQPQAPTLRPPAPPTPPAPQRPPAPAPPGVPTAAPRPAAPPPPAAPARPAAPPPVAAAPPAAPPRPVAPPVPQVEDDIQFDEPEPTLEPPPRPAAAPAPTLEPPPRLEPPPKLEQPGEAAPRPAEGFNMIPVEPPPSRPEPKAKPKKKFSAVRAGVLTAVASAALVGWWFNAKKQVVVAPDPPQAVIGSVPAGAKIYAGSEVVGQTPLVVVQGQYDTVTLKMDGYQDKTVGLEFSERKVNRMLETLDPSLGQVALKGVPKDAKISLDGAEPVAVGVMTTDWPMGTHKVKVILSDQEPAEFEVTVSKDSAVDLGAEVEKIVSVRPRLLLTVSGPAKFNVEVSKVGHENIQAASGAGNLSLPLQDGRGIYKISVTADGYLGYNKDIEIAGPRKMSVVLQPRPAPAPAPAPVSGGGTGGGGFRPAPAPAGGSGGHRISAPDF